jgi:uncharacterized membrane protein (DUF2068 family)
MGVSMGRGESYAASEHGRHAQVLRAVASLELVKGLAVFIGGCSVLFLIHKDPWDIANNFLRMLHVNPDWRFSQLVLDWADRLTDSQLWTVAAFSFLYATLRFVEAYGLWRARIWAEWFALISGMIYLPFEIYAIHEKPNLLHGTLLLVSVAVILYMAYLRSTSRRRLHKEQPEAMS